MDPVVYKVAGADEGPSPIIWADFPIQRCKFDPNFGFFFHEDWNGKGVIATNQNAAVQSNGYLAFTDNDAYTEMARTTARTTNTAGLGRVAMNLKAGDTDQSQIVLNWPTGAVCAEMDTHMGMLCFEANVAFSSVTDTDMGWFLGLTQEATAANSFLGDESADIADVDAIGWLLGSADADSAVPVYQTSGNGTTVNKRTAYSTALAISTNYRFGIQYEPEKEVCRWFVDGVQIGADLSIGTSDFPDGEELAVTLAVQAPDGGAGSGDVDVYMTINWWQVGQVYAR